MQVKNRFLTLSSQHALRQHGFSLIETLIALGAFGLLAVLMQSVLIMGHSFQISQQRLMDITQTTQLLKQVICQTNASFKNINMRVNQTYTIKTTDEGKREYKSNSSISHKPFLLLDMNEVQKSERADPPIESEANKFISDQKRIDKKNAFSTLRDIDFKSPNPLSDPLYYKVLQDSHTIIKINIRDEMFTSKAKISGYIFTSRCTENTDNALTAEKALGEKALKKSALYILEQPVRPYYVPGETTPLIGCYEGAPAKGNKPKKDWVPRIYVIHLNSKDISLLPPHDEKTSGVFIAEPVYIQQEPEWHSINNIWGAGFIVTTNAKLHPNQSAAFKLEIFFLRNSCMTSPMHLAHCPHLKIGMNLSEIPIASAGNRMMKDFIYSDISSCAGYSSALGTSTLIGL